MSSMAQSQLKLTVNDTLYLIEIGDLTASPITVQVNGHPYLVNFETTTPVVLANGHEVASAAVARQAPLSKKAAQGPTARQVVAPMPGHIITILVKPGERVNIGQPLCSLEAMKMKNSIRSPRDGVIATVEISPGQAVGHGEVLLTFE